jgi:hypothetical protein
MQRTCHAAVAGFLSPLICIREAICCEMALPIAAIVPSGKTKLYNSL